MLFQARHVHSTNVNVGSITRQVAGLGLTRTNVTING